MRAWVMQRTSVAEETARSSLQATGESSATVADHSLLHAYLPILAASCDSPIEISTSLDCLVESCNRTGGMAATLRA